MAEIDALLQTVMFTIYGNQYESREEHLLLTMFQVYILRDYAIQPANLLSSLCSHTSSITHQTTARCFAPTPLYLE